MIKSRILNKDVLSNQTRNNRNKAIEIILTGGNSDNKCVRNILESVNQQAFEFIQIENYVLSGNVNCKDLYDRLSDFGKGAIPVILASVIKNNIKFIVVEKQGIELEITAKLLSDIDASPSLYNIVMPKQIDDYYEYAKIFNVDYNKGKKNIFKYTTDSMKEWFFNLSNYAISTNKQYIGNGEYLDIDPEIISFKNSLRGANITPYLYIDKKLPLIFPGNTSHKLKNSKHFIDNTLSNLKEMLMKDINSIFPKGVSNWVYNIPNKAKNRIYMHGEEKFIKICKNSKEANLLEEIIKYIIGLKVEYWNEETPSVFFKKLNRIKDYIDEKCSEDINNGFKIISLRENKDLGERIYCLNDSRREEIQLIKKDILSLFEDYGQSITHSEKIGAILEIAFEVGGN